MELLYMLAGAMLFAGGFFCARFFAPKYQMPDNTPAEPEGPTADEVERAKLIAKQWENWIGYDGRPRE